MISINITKKLDSIGKRRSRAFAIHIICGNYKTKDGLLGALFEILYGKEGDSWSQGEFDPTPPGSG